MVRATLTTNSKWYICIPNTYILGRCLQHRGGEPERAKGADGMQLFELDCIAYIVDAETDRVFACMNDMSRLRLMLMKVGCCNGAMLRIT